MDDQQAKKKEPVAHRDPSFGSSLLSDNFGQRPSDDDMTTRLEATAEIQQDHRPDIPGVAEKEEESTTDPLLQNPDGATQMFNDMHGISGGLEGALDVPPANIGLRHMAGLSVGAQSLGNTDWGCGTDGGRSGKPQDGVPYGSFVGV